MTPKMESNTKHDRNQVPTGGVDTHAHVFAQSLSFVHAGEGYIPDYDAPIETFLQKLSQYGLTHGILIQPSFLGSDNEYLLRCVETRPKELRGIVIVEPGTPLKDLRAMKHRGAVGIRLITYGTPAPDWKHPAWTALAERIVELEWIVEIYAPAIQLQAVADPLLKYGCKLLIDHYGRPDPLAGVKDPGFKYLLSLAKSEHVWVDISGPYRNGDDSDAITFSKEYLGQLRDSFGTERLLWGSDWPCVQFEPWQNYKKSWIFLHETIPDEKGRLDILWDTPAALFGLHA